MSPAGLAIVGAILLVGAVLVVNGVRGVVRARTGERVRATVTECVDSGRARNRRTDCTGTWTAGGRVVVGTVQGATSDQVGRTVDVTVEGDTAYTRDLRLPLLLTLLGLLPLALGAALLRGMLAPRA